MDDKQLLAIALKFLGYRPRSQKEILDFLHKKTSDENQISQILDQLTKLKLVNDREFSDWLVKSRSRNRGSIFIKQDLKKRGVDASQIQVDDLSIAINLLKKKESSWKSLLPNAYRLKASRYLSYRGIPGSVIAEALKKRYNQEDVN